MKNDITSKVCIKELISSFYEKVKKDNMLGPLFTEVFAVNWNSHIELMTTFWENSVFQTGEYTGNPIVTHRKLHAKYAIHAEYFDRWVKLFVETVDELFEGRNADMAKQRASNIATVLRIKVHSAW